MEEHPIVQVEEPVLPAGFKASGTACGIKAQGRDLALIVSEVPAVAAGTFTTNRIQAAPVKWCRSLTAAGQPARAIVVNSGNANACNGGRGLVDTQVTAAAAAEHLGVLPEDIFVCSTGPIGVPLPLPKLVDGLPEAVGALSGEGGRAATEAIMTTDTAPKFASVMLVLEGREITLTGLAKGSGMIEPNMATMLAFILTDAAVERTAMESALRDSVDLSFNRITVDGDRSTNDTVLMLANGAAGNSPLAPGHASWDPFKTALRTLTRHLALQIVRDGEGATRLVTIRVTGAATEADAEKAARAIANSALNKTSFAGADPAWGRVMDAIGYSGAEIRENRVAIRYNEADAVCAGISAGTPWATLKDEVDQDTFTLHVDLGLGSGETEVYTCDLTEEYVRINLVD